MSPHRSCIVSPTCCNSHWIIVQTNRYTPNTHSVLFPPNHSLTLCPLANHLLAVKLSKVLYLCFHSAVISVSQGSVTHFPPYTTWSWMPGGLQSVMIGSFSLMMWCRRSWRNFPSSWNPLSHTNTSHGDLLPAGLLAPKSTVSIYNKVVLQFSHLIFLIYWSLLIKLLLLTVVGHQKRRWTESGSLVSQG